MPLPSPKTMLTYASILEKPKYQVDEKTGIKYRLATGEIVEAACEALRQCALAAQGSADCGEVAELRAKLDLAIKGIRDFTEGHYDNPRQYRPEPCKHGQRWYEGCQSCDDAFMEQLASSLTSTTRGGGA